MGSCNSCITSTSAHGDCKKRRQSFDSISQNNINSSTTTEGILRKRSIEEVHEPTVASATTARRPYVAFIEDNKQSQTIITAEKRSSTVPANSRSASEVDYTDDKSQMTRTERFRKLRDAVRASRSATIVEDANARQEGFALTEIKASVPDNLLHCRKGPSLSSNSFSLFPNQTNSGSGLGFSITEDPTESGKLKQIQHPIQLSRFAPIHSSEKKKKTSNTTERNTAAVIDTPGQDASWPKDSLQSLEKSDGIYRVDQKLQTDFRTPEQKPFSRPAKFKTSISNTIDSSATPKTKPTEPAPTATPDVPMLMQLSPSGVSSSVSPGVTPNTGPTNATHNPHDANLNRFSLPPQELSRPNRGPADGGGNKLMEESGSEICPLMRTESSLSAQLDQQAGSMAAASNSVSNSGHRLSFSTLSPSARKVPPKPIYVPTDAELLANPHFRRAVSQVEAFNQSRLEAFAPLSATTSVTPKLECAPNPSIDTQQPFTQQEIPMKCGPQDALLDASRSASAISTSPMHRVASFIPQPDYTINHGDPFSFPAFPTFVSPARFLANNSFATNDDVLPAIAASSIGTSASGSMAHNTPVFVGIHDGSDQVYADSVLDAVSRSTLFASATVTANQINASFPPSATAESGVFASSLTQTHPIYSRKVNPNSSNTINYAPNPKASTSLDQTSSILLPPPPTPYVPASATPIFKNYGVPSPNHTNSPLVVAAGHHQAMIHQSGGYSYPHQYRSSNTSLAQHDPAKTTIRVNSGTGVLSPNPSHRTPLTSLNSTPPTFLPNTLRPQLYTEFGMPATTVPSSYSANYYHNGNATQLPSQFLPVPLLPAPMNASPASQLISFAAGSCSAYVIGSASSGSLTAPGSKPEEKVLLNATVPYSSMPTTGSRRLSNQQLIVGTPTAAILQQSSSINTGTLNTMNISNSHCICKPTPDPEVTKEATDGNKKESISSAPEWWTALQQFAIIGERAMMSADQNMQSVDTNNQVQNPVSNSGEEKKDTNLVSAELTTPMGKMSESTPVAGSYAYSASWEQQTVANSPSHPPK